MTNERVFAGNLLDMKLEKPYDVIKAYPEMAWQLIKRQHDELEKIKSMHDKEVVCPKCSSDDIRPFDGETDPDYTYYHCKCSKCNTNFSVVLKPVKIKIIK